MTAYRVSYTLKTISAGVEVIRKIRQTMVSADVAAKYYLNNSDHSPKIRRIVVSDRKLNPSHARLHTVHA